MNDEWRPISKCPEFEINRNGDIRRIVDGKMVQASPSRRVYGGYVRGSLYTSDKRSIGFTLHKLLAVAFIPNPEGKRYVHHKDGDRTNNSLDNLEWVTSKEHREHHRKYKKT